MESRLPAWAVLCAPRAPLPRPEEVSPVGADPRGGLTEGPRKNGPWNNEDTATSQFLPRRWWWRRQQQQPPMQSCRHRCHFHPLVPSTHLRSEGLLELEDLLYVFRLLFPGGAALAVLPGHGRLELWGSRGTLGRGRREPRAGAEGMPGAGMQSRRMRSARRLGLPQSFLLGSFLFRLGCCCRGPSLALISAALRHRLPASAAACQPHFLLLSCLAPAPSPPPAPLPQPASSRGLPALPVHPAASPPPHASREAAFGDVPLPSAGAPFPGRQGAALDHGDTHAPGPSAHLESPSENG